MSRASLVNGMDERDRQRLRSLARTITRLAFGEQSVDRKQFDAHLAAMWVEECDSTRSRLERVADRWWATVVAAASSEAAGSVPATAFLRAVDECIGGSDAERAEALWRTLGPGEPATRANVPRLLAAAFELDDDGGGDPPSGSAPRPLPPAFVHAAVSVGAGGSCLRRGCGARQLV
mmetsp:Transcript_41618/g.137922  ORF Transcript_41618/g.137922 Transcript_41618/m.137922 type:complete len:177 (+) Transcript_41618:64-594(+)